MTDTYMDISQYAVCPFDELINSTTFDDNKYNSFVFQQIILDITENENKVNYSIYDNHKRFGLLRNRFNVNHKNLIIICSKNNSHILKYSLQKIKLSNHIKYDILIVDDGSISDDILKLSDEFETSYLRIESNDNIFNYSIINNIASIYAKFFDKETIIFYNNDLWPSCNNSLHNLLVKHHHYQSGISGCRLLYPTEQEYTNIGKPQHVLKESIHKVYDTIQHGGIYFSPYIKDISTKKYKIYYPNHIWRFYPKTTKLSCLDSRCFAVTGAINIISTDNFYKLNGFNQSLSTSFQDIDLCLRAVEKHLAVYYIGSEDMYHAESLTVAQIQINNNERHEKITLSDNILWGLLWQKRAPNLLGYEIN